jgi:hypothetical protein
MQDRPLVKRKCPTDSLNQDVMATAPASSDANLTRVTQNESTPCLLNPLMRETGLHSTKDNLQEHSPALEGHDAHGSFQVSTSKKTRPRKIQRKAKHNDVTDTGILKLPDHTPDAAQRESETKEPTAKIRENQTRKKAMSKSRNGATIDQSTRQLLS